MKMTATMGRKNFPRKVTTLHSVWFDGGIAEMAACLAMALSFFGLLSRPSFGAEKIDVELMHPGEAAPALVLPSNAPSCVRIAVEDLARDFLEATGKNPDIVDAIPDRRAAIVVGVVEPGKQQVGSFGGLDVAGLSDLTGLSHLVGQWESFVIRPVTDRLLVVAGSDDRGTMYGIYELSERLLGTDPLKHWTGNIPKQLDRVSWTDGALREGPPTFRYRGLFINDEDSLMAWHGEEINADIGPVAYSEILETISRLKGNMIAPGMYATRMDGASRQLANDRGIYYTASHLELLLANPQRYWNSYSQEHWGEVLDYSYSDHPEKLRSFWQDSIKRQQGYDNIWPIGLRGITDFAFWVSDKSAPTTIEGRAAVVNRAVQAQLSLLDETLGKDDRPLTSLTLYEELAGLFNTGLIHVRDDTVLVWCDAGYDAKMPELPTGSLQENPGGNGVYFHLANCDKQWSQWVPLDHLQKEFQAIIESRADEYALFNVGDMREIPLTMNAAMDLVWDATPWLASNEQPAKYLDRWAGYQFGEEAKPAVVDLYRRYYALEFPYSCTYVVEWLAPSTTTRHLYGIWQATSAIPFAEEANAPELLKVYASLKDFSNVHQRRKIITESFLMESSDRWDALYDEAIRVIARVPEARRRFFFDNLVLQIQTSRLINHWGLDILKAFQKCKAGDFADASEAFEKAARSMDVLVAEREKACYGKWKDWFRGAYHNGWEYNLWSLQPKWRAEDARHLAELSRQAAAVSPNSVLMIDAAVNSDDASETNIVLPQDFDVAKVEEVRLYGCAYGRPTVKEMKWLLNENEITFKAMDNSKNPFYRAEFDPSFLKPGANTLSHASKDGVSVRSTGTSPVRLALSLVVTHSMNE